MRTISWFFGKELACHDMTWEHNQKRSGARGSSYGSTAERVMSTGRVQQAREMQSDGGAIALALDSAIREIVRFAGDSPRAAALDCVLSPNMNSHRQVGLAGVLRDYLH